MMTFKKALGIPVAALVAVAVLAGSAQAAPRDHNGRDHHREMRGDDFARSNDRGGPRGHWQEHERFGRHGYRMGVKEVRRSLRHRGFHRIRIEDRKPFVFKVSAIGRNGVPFRIVVDRVSGQILHMRPAGRGFHWSYRW